MHGLLLIVVIMLGVAYRRIRRSFGFQQFFKGRMLTRMVMLAIVGILFLVLGFAHPVAYIFDVVGIALGSIMAYYANRTTSFEWRENAWFYRANPWIGAILLVLFIARLGYRMYQDLTLMGAAAGGQGQDQAQLPTFSHDPATTIVLFTLITYYIVYYTFLIRRYHQELEGPSSDFDDDSNF